MITEQECSQSISQKLPDTCPISQNDQSQQEPWSSQSTLQPWGRLCSMKPQIQSIDLAKDVYTVGRGPSCDLPVQTEIDGIINGSVSKVHFRIRRTTISSTNLEDYIVHLDDLSSNGTFVNGRKIGKGRSVILENNNEISICLPKCKAFIYISSNLDTEVRSYPDNIKINYAISRILGTGSFGQVRLVFEKCSGKALAMKIIPKKRFFSDAKQQLYNPIRTQREVSILRALSNVFIIKFEGVIDSKNHMFIFTEYMEGGELFNRVKCGALNESDAKLYFLQLAMAVRYLHSHDIIHRDIKLENILLSSKEGDSLIKLSDFGFSKFLDSESVMMTYCGTPLYIAPEILKNRGKAGSYDKRVDIWSMGVVLYICLSGIPPFSQSNTQQLTEQILRGQYRFPSRHWRQTSPKAIHLVRRILTVNPKTRISMNAILNHNWTKDRNVNIRLNKLLKKTTIETDTFESSESEIDSDTELGRISKKPRSGD